jgi:hypothetical protein
LAFGRTGPTAWSWRVFPIGAATATGTWRIVIAINTIELMAAKILPLLQIQIIPNTAFLLWV